MRRRTRRDLRRMRHREHLHRSDSRFSRWPIASATAPPTPVSISSKTSVGAEPRSASATFSASRKRDSSPPDATFMIGPAACPDWSGHGTRRRRCLRRASSASVVISTMKRARSSFSAGSSVMTAAAECLPALMALGRRTSAPPHRNLPLARPTSARAGKLLLARIEIGEIGDHPDGKRRQFGHRNGIFARRSSQRKQPLLDPLQFLRIVFGLAQRRLDFHLRVGKLVERGIEQRHSVFEQARRLMALALQPAHQRGDMRHGRGIAVEELGRLGNIAGDPLGLHHLLNGDRQDRPLRHPAARAFQFLDGRRR
jgi:hypothetical protein